MPDLRIEDMIRTDQLRQAYGDTIVLSEDGKEQATVYRIVLEFSIQGRSYAALMPEDAKPDEEISVFNVHAAGDQFEIETIDDDDEWEDISELVDEALTAFPQQNSNQL